MDLSKGLQSTVVFKQRASSSRLGERDDDVHVMKPCKRARSSLTECSCAASAARPSRVQVSAMMPHVGKPVRKVMKTVVAMTDKSASLCTGVSALMATMHSVQVRRRASARVPMAGLAAGAAAARRSDGSADQPAPIVVDTVTTASVRSSPRAWRKSGDNRSASTRCPDRCRRSCETSTCKTAPAARPPSHRIDYIRNTP